MDRWDSVLSATRYPWDWKDSDFFNPPGALGLVGLSPFSHQVSCGLVGLSPFSLQAPYGLVRLSPSNLQVPRGLAGLIPFSPQVPWGLAGPSPFSLKSFQPPRYPGDWVPGTHGTGGTQSFQPLHKHGSWCVLLLGFSVYLLLAQKEQVYLFLAFFI